MNENTFNARFSVIDELKGFNSMPYKVSITDELLKLARNARCSYYAYLDEQKRNAEKKKKQEADEEESKKKELLSILENVKMEMKSIKSLKSQLISEEKAYKETIEESEQMQTLLKNSAKSVTNKIVLQELIGSLENLRNKEKEQRVRVEKLRGKVQKRKSQLIKRENTVNKKFKASENVSDPFSSKK